MKKYLVILQAAICLLSSSASYAIHQSFTYTNTIQYCSDVFCPLIPSLEEGSILTLNGDLDIDPNGEYPDDVLTSLVDFTIEIFGPSATLNLTPSNTSVISSNILTTSDEFEHTTILGGTAIFDTSNAFDNLLTFALPSELIYNFDDDSIMLYVDGNLAASTTAVVPIPNAFFLLFSGIMLLVSISRKKSKV